MRGSWNLRRLAVLGLVLPFLFAVATQYSIQIIPDFDDYDWDGPDDGSLDEKKAHTGPSPGDLHSVEPHELASPVRCPADLPSRTALQKRLDGNHSSLISLPHQTPALFRGPPLAS